MPDADVSSAAVDFFAPPPKPKPKAHKTALDAEDFTALFLAQLKNQDPLNPAESKDMILQTAAISSIQQGHKQNEHLAALREERDAAALASAAGLVGRKVAVNGERIDHGEAGADIFYQLGSAAQAVVAEIVDDQGTLVRSLSVDRSRPRVVPAGSSNTPCEAGAQQLRWDGTSNDGQLAPPGRYRVTIRATDEAGLPVASKTQQVGRVDQVDVQRGRPRLVVGGQSVGMQQIEGFLAD